MGNNAHENREERMSKMSQKEAVYQAVINVTGHGGEGKCEPTKEQRAQVNAILFEGFKSGAIELDREYNDTDLKGYVSGLQSNWLRKDKRLNGGIKYTAKNPGSRARSTDSQLQAMKALLTTMSGPEFSDADRAEVQSHIDARVNELKAAKQAKTVNFDALPSELRAKFGIK
jgi:hypothetical protein